MPRGKRYIVPGHTYHVTHRCHRAFLLRFQKDRTAYCRLLREYVRAGVVEEHPREWAWTGYQELMGLRTRYRMVDQARLLRHVELILPRLRTRKRR